MASSSFLIVFTILALISYGYAVFNIPKPLIMDFAKCVSCASDSKFQADVVSCGKENPDILKKIETDCTNTVLGVSVMNAGAWGKMCDNEAQRKQIVDCLIDGKDKLGVIKGENATKADKAQGCLVLLNSLHCVGDKDSDS